MFVPGSRALAAENPSAETSLGSWLDRIQFQSVQLPAEGVLYSGRAVVSVYALLRNGLDDLVVIYGYTTENGDSIYRAYSLGRSQVLAQFDHPPTSGGTVPSPFTQIRDYVARESVESWPVKSLLMPLPLSPSLKVQAHHQGQCAGPFAYWLEWQRLSSGRTQYNQPVVQSSARMMLRNGDRPRPFFIQAACPWAQNSPNETVAGVTTIQSILLAQGIATGNGGLLAFGSTEPLVVRFDSGGTSRPLEKPTANGSGRIELRSFNPDAYDLRANPSGSALDGSALAKLWHTEMLRKLGLKGN
ncbi:MAG: hypothetical protein ORO03_08255 [Alphaproteobacteria bacterium]|nr:hypothetical protein [Alphaproteobacteria bacterium]